MRGGPRARYSPRVPVETTPSVPAAPRAWTPVLALAGVVALGLFPFRVVLPDARTTLLGTANDSVHAVWGLWYLAYGAPDDALWPAGIAGTIVGGPTLLLGFVGARLAGPALAYTACCALQVALALVGVGLLARRLGGGAWSAPIAALLSPRATAARTSSSRGVMRSVRPSRTWDTRRCATVGASTV